MCSLEASTPVECEPVNGFLEQGFFFFFGSFECGKCWFPFLFAFPASVSCGKHLCQNWILVTVRVMLAHVHRLFPPLLPWLTAGVRCDGPWAGPWAELTCGDKQPLWLIQLGVRLGWLWTVRGCPRSHAEKAPHTHKTPSWASNPQSQHCEATMLITGCFSVFRPFFFLPIIAVKTAAWGNMFSSHFFFLPVRVAVSEVHFRKINKNLGVPDSN